jgi:hypothetical protein
MNVLRHDDVPHNIKPTQIGQSTITTEGNKVKITPLLFSDQTLSHWWGTHICGWIPEVGTAIISGSQQ